MLDNETNSSGRKTGLLQRNIVAALSGVLMAALSATNSFACNRPGTPQFLVSRWTSPNIVELDILNKSQASEGTLYYEFSINGRFSEQRRIESPFYDQRLPIALDTNHFAPGRTYQFIRVQLWARRVDNDCRSGPTQLYPTAINPYYHGR